MDDHDEIIVRVPKGWKGSVTVNADKPEQIRTPEAILDDGLDTAEPYTMDEEPIGEPAVIDSDGDVPYGGKEPDYDPFRSVPPAMLSARVIGGHGVKTVFHETPTSNLDTIRELVESLHRSLLANNPHAPIRIMEIGPWIGESTVALCQGIDPVAGGVVTCVDTFMGTSAGYLSDVVEQVGGPAQVREMFFENIGDLYQNPIHLLDMTSMKAARDLNIGIGQLDLVFIDGCYEPVAISDDVRVWAELLSQDGILAGQLCGPDSQRGFEALKQVLAGLNSQLKFYESTTVWAVMRKDLVLMEEPAIAP